MEVVAEISELFDEEGISHVIFKTLRPYPEYRQTVADIDVLNMDSRNNYKKILEFLKKSGYLFMERGSTAQPFRIIRLGSRRSP